MIITQTRTGRQQQNLGRLNMYQAIPRVMVYGFGGGQWTDSTWTDSTLVVWGTQCNAMYAPQFS